jgi:hypothetical protein
MAERPPATAAFGLKADGHQQFLGELADDHAKQAALRRQRAVKGIKVAIDEVVMVTITVLFSDCVLRRKEIR